MGCNDCHTPGYAQAAGKVPEPARLTGDALGYKGAWGTTYPANLRLLFASMTRDEWIRYAKSVETRPPMPWFTLRATSERDLSAMYAYMKTLGPAGKPAPAYVSPGQQPAGPVVQFPQWQQRSTGRRHSACAGSVRQTSQGERPYDRFTLRRSC